MNLQKKVKWFHPKRNLAVGDLVIVQEPNLPAPAWKLGRVIDVHPDAKGAVRWVVSKN